MDQSKDLIISFDSGSSSDFSSVVKMKCDENGRMKILEIDPEIVEVEVEEVSDKQLAMERRLGGLRILTPTLNIKPNQNMSWDEFEQLYNTTNEQSEEDE